MKNLITAIIILALCSSASALVKQQDYFSATETKPLNEKQIQTVLKNKLTNLTNRYREANTKAAKKQQVLSVLTMIENNSRDAFYLPIVVEAKNNTVNKEILREMLESAENIVKNERRYTTVIAKAVAAAHIKTVLQSIK